jgi:calpain-15
VELFKDGIEPADILQGSLGNSYFLCALAALAENPERIQKLFLQKERNKSGIYGVFVCKDGIS